MIWTLWRRRVLLGAVLISISACSTLSGRISDSAPSSSINPISAVPFFPQERFQCGPAALATMLTWAGVVVVPEDLEKKVYLENRKGSLQLEMLAAARQAGVLPIEHQGGFDDLWLLLEAGKPALVLQNFGFSWYPKYHYAVVVGYDAEAREVLLRSGKQKLRRESLKLFAQTWSGAQNWLVSVSRAGDVPPGVSETDFLAAVSDLEQTGQPELALTFYRAAVVHWPHTMLSWMALGNNLYTQAKYQDAEKAFRNALPLASSHPAPSHNLAWALIKQGRPGAALPFAREAVELSHSLPVEQKAAYASALEALSTLGLDITL